MRHLSRQYFPSVLKRLVPVLLLPACTGLLFTGWKKWAEDKANIYKYVAPPPSGGVIPETTPLSGSIKGVMLAGKTYTLGSDINIPVGDTLLIQEGVTINATNSAGIIVHGVLGESGYPDQPEYIYRARSNKE